MNEKIEQAVNNCREEIAKAQAMNRALHLIGSYIREQEIDRPYTVDKKEVYGAVNILHMLLYGMIARKWEKLMYLIPINKEASDLARQRAKSWFEQKNTEIMSFLGEYGSYYVADAEKFRKELEYAFDIRTEQQEERD
jgi:hypothetical protein